MRFRVSHLLWAMFLIAYFCGQYPVWVAIEEWAADWRGGYARPEAALVHTILIGGPFLFVGFVAYALLSYKPPEPPQRFTWTPEQVD